MALSSNLNAVLKTAAYKRRANAKGITLVELAMSMMVVAVIGVGVSGLMKTGVEHNISQRQMQTMQMMAMDLVEDLRYDLRTADTVNNVGGGSNTLTISSSGQTITYNLNAGTHQMTRRSSTTGVTKIYNDPNVFMNNLQFDCKDTSNNSIGCFMTDPTLGTATNGTPKAVVLRNVTVTAALNGNANTALDIAFGAPSFRLNQFTFNVAAATEFQ